MNALRINSHSTSSKRGHSALNWQGATFSMKYLRTPSPDNQRDSAPFNHPETCRAPSDSIGTFYFRAITSTSPNGTGILINFIQIAFESFSLTVNKVKSSQDSSEHPTSPCLRTAFRFDVRREELTYSDVLPLRSRN